MNINTIEWGETPSIQIKFTQRYGEITTTKKRLLYQFAELSDLFLGICEMLQEGKPNTVYMLGLIQLLFLEISSPAVVFNASV